MNHTSIEWIVNPDGSRPGWSWNPITGCLNNCDYCYARKLANGRLKPLYLANSNLAPIIERGGIDPVCDPFYPRFWKERLAELQRGIDDADYQSYIRQKGRGIFVCDMGDLFGIGVPEQWTRRILEVIGDDCNAMHRFYLLTKQPQNLIKFSFPENAWVGVTACNVDMMDEALITLGDIEAKVKYVSIEPFLGEIPEPYYSFKPEVDWLIIGACTGTKLEMGRLSVGWLDFLNRVKPYGNKWTLQPKIEWVREIVGAADKAGIPVFLKDNLEPLFLNAHMYWEGFYGEQGLRREMPI